MIIGLFKTRLPLLSIATCQLLAMPSAVGIAELAFCVVIADITTQDLFGGVKPSMAPDRSFPLREPADARRRVAEQIWTSSDDVLLKTLVERYPNNWPLIADAFNSSRVTVSTDLRLPWDCYERYNTRWSGHSTTFKEPMSTSSLGDASPVPASRDQMTTRGVKRLASVSAGVVPSPGGYANEPSKKRRRHLLMSETIRKAAKKREANQKANGKFFSCLFVKLGYSCLLSSAEEVISSP